MVFKYAYLEVGGGARAFCLLFTLRNYFAQLIFYCFLTISIFFILHDQLKY